MLDCPSRPTGPAAPPVVLPPGEPKISFIGTRAVVLEAPGELGLEQQNRIWALADLVSTWPNVEEAVPGVTNLMLVLRTPLDDVDAFVATLRESWRHLPWRQRRGKRIDIPVIYGGELGFDLPAVAKRAGLSEHEVIRIHAERIYTVFAVASSPGFGYLSGLDPRIFMPRKTVPSLNMRAGSVTIGGMQTGVAVLTSPNGWNAIGWAEQPMFDPHGETPSRMQPGDEVRFRIDRIEL